MRHDGARWDRQLTGPATLGRARRRRMRALRRYCRRLLRNLAVQSPLNIERLCHDLGARRDRPIEMAPMPLATEGTFGACLATPRGDLIFYEQHTTAIHQTHIILHEVGHLLAGHQSGDGGSDIVRQLMPDLENELIDSVLGRTSSAYDEDREYEAEAIATTIVAWADILGAQPIQLTSIDHDTPVGRIQQALYERRGWQ